MKAETTKPSFPSRVKEYFAANRVFSARNVAYLAVLLSLVLVLQIWGGLIQIAGLSLSFVLVPIVLGGILLGWGAGAFLGFAFGFVTLMYGVAGAEPFTAFLFNNSPVMTVLICLVKGTAAGVVPALLYKLLKRKSTFLAAVVASLSAPIVNTGIFVLGCLMISGTLAGWIQSLVDAGAMTETVPVAYYIFIGLAGWNFLIEFAINLVLAPAIHRVVLVVEKQISTKKHKPHETTGESQELKEEQREPLSEEGNQEI